MLWLGGAFMISRPMPLAHPRGDMPPGLFYCMMAGYGLYIAFMIGMVVLDLMDSRRRDRDSQRLETLVSQANQYYRDRQPGLWVSPAEFKLLEAEYRASARVITYNWGWALVDRISDQEVARCIIPGRV